ncbi:MAG: acetyl-CoA carboxylase carboxyltransferase subunit alpha [Bacteroidales bacterium]|nr:acetyl-CoA carboxylase carboxyltransferase subunit alpha [Bacteroidales bacterium]MBO7566666.1 acetyl-CoA carboxylase carboxyltransferase subunit alpha [Bacteroidales bacterium]MBP5682479.1 acetyl-CoA carboxylase carboxyltransferase subunit alpha [Bacteroidales bacterium]
MQLLEFEQPIQELEDQLVKAEEIQKAGSVDVEQTINDLKAKILSTRKDIYDNLTPWQRVQVSRHPERPYTLGYIRNICDDFIELHGDRNIKDDTAMVGGWGMIGDQSIMFVGQQKGENTKLRQYRNFGMANPEGYRKALRLMRMAEKFQKPIVTLIDTPGAYPGSEAEERGQAEAIARNIYEMFRIKTPIICIVIGEGASGGAIGIGVGDKVYMLENTWYSVIAPESCSSILWRSWDFKREAAAALKLTAKDMYANKLIDGIIPEPVGGAHTNPTEMYQIIKKTIVDSIAELKQIPIDTLVSQRIEKFCQMGVYNE